MLSRPEPFIRVENLTAGYGGSPVISGVFAQVGKGEVVCVIGPNGAGKSTMLKALVGLLKVTEGQVTVGGRNVTNLRTDDLARMGVAYVPQVNDVFDSLTVAENLEIGGYTLRPSRVSARIEEVVRLFPVLGQMLRRPAAKLSGGERKMLAIGRVLMLKPTLLLLDEPTANLAPKLSHELLTDHIKRLAEQGTAILVVEQKAVSVLAISDWAYVLVSGSSRLDGPAPELLARPDFGEVFLGQTPAS